MRIRYTPLLLTLALTGTAHADIGSAYLGAGAMYAPRYDGSKDYRVAPLIDASVVFKNGWYVASTEGIGYRFNFTNKFYATGSIGLDAGRKDKNDVARPGADFLKGMGDIKASALANIGAGFNFNDRTDISLVANKAIGSSSYGMTLHALAHVVAWKSDRDRIDVNGIVNFGNAEHNQTYFGVSREQGERTAFAPFTARSGIYAISATATWTHQLSDHWLVRASAGATHYTNDVKRSPIVQKSTGYILGSSIDYRF